MKSGNCFLLVVGIVMIGLCEVSARASLVSYTFTGLMDDPLDSTPFVFGTIPFNAPFSTTFTYDDSQPTPNGATSSASYSLTSISVTIGSDTATGTGGNLYVYDKVGGYVDDLINATSSSIVGTLGGITPSALQVVLQNTSGGVLPGPGIPGPGLTFSQFTPGVGTFVELDEFNNNPNLNKAARGDIGASVPEPGSLSLVAIICVAGLAFRARRSRWILATIPLAILGTVPQFARAANYSWNDGSGNWNTVTDWTVGGTTATTVPPGGSSVYMTNSDSVSRSVLYDSTIATMDLASLTINQTGTGGATNLLQLSNGTIEADTANIGTGGIIRGYGTFEGNTLSNSGTIYASGGAGQYLYIFFPSITNSGTIETSSAGSAYIESRVDNSGGNILASGGPLTLYSTVVSGGTLTSDSSAFINLTGTGTELDGSSQGALTISTGSNVVVNSTSPVSLTGTIINYGTISDYIPGGALPPMTFQIGDAKTHEALLEGSGSLVMSQNGAKIQGQTGTESLINDVGHTINVNAGAGNATISNLASFTNNGTLSVSSGTSATLSNVNSFYNYGNINVTAGGSLTLQSTPFQQYQGTTTLNGTLSSPTGYFLQGGDLTGGGELDANLDQTGGTLNPGDAPALFTINGSYDLVNTSPFTNDETLNIEIGGYTPDTGFSVLDVNGTATLNGNLNLTLVNGFVPQVGDTFTILNSQGDSGTFTATTSSDPGLSYTVNYGPNYAQVMITAVPEPATAGLMGICAAALLSRRRRCRGLPILI